MKPLTHVLCFKLLVTFAVWCLPLLVLPKGFFFTQDPLLRPLTVGIYSFIGRYQIQWNLLMAASLVAIIPVLVLLLIVQRQLIAGLTPGAVK